MNPSETFHQCASLGGASAAIILVTSTIAASAYTDRLPSQMAVSAPIVLGSELAATVQPQLSLFEWNKVPTIPAPLWLLERMEALRQMPPPTLQKVQTQWKASAEVRTRLDDKQSAS